MAYTQNPGKSNEGDASGETGADGALKNFYADCFNSRDCQIRLQPGASSPLKYTNILPECVIGGNCTEEGLHESITGDGTTIIRDTVRHHFNLMDRNSSFYQSGTGKDAYRKWQSNDHKQIFTRQGDHAEMHFNQGDSQIDNEYDFDIQKGITSRKYSNWTVNQHTGTSSDDSNKAAAENQLNINISGDGAYKETSLDFISTEHQLRFHASKNGLEIATTNGQYRFLLVGGKLYALDALEAESTADHNYRDWNGNWFKMRQLSITDNVRAALSLDDSGGVTIDGLKVHVDGDGKVIAQSTDSDKVSITISADGTQTVGGADGYWTRVGTDGRLLIFGPDHQCLGFFDPVTGIIGNEHILLGADFSSFEGKMIDMMGIVYETANLRTSALAIATADQAAVSALKQADTNSAFVKGQLDSGTVGANCFAALNASIGDLTNALGACLAADARNNLGAIISALGIAAAQLSLSTAKYNTQLLAEKMGVHDKFTLAKVQKDEGNFGDSVMIAKQAAESIQPGNQMAGAMPAPAPQAYVA